MYSGAPGLKPFRSPGFVVWLLIALRALKEQAYLSFRDRLMAIRDEDVVNALQAAAAELDRVNYRLEKKAGSPERRRLEHRKLELERVVEGFRALQRLRCLEESVFAGENGWPDRDERGRFLPSYI
jgi:hypothetical protein